MSIAPNTELFRPFNLQPSAAPPDATLQANLSLLMQQPKEEISLPASVMSCSRFVEQKVS